MKATVNTNNGTKTINITPVEVKMTKTEETKMNKHFDRETRVMEWVGGCTYTVNINGKRLKSSSMEELQEMHKAAWNNLPIPERKCFFHK